MIREEEIEQIIAYLNKEAIGYAEIGGMNEVWGLIHAAKKLVDLVKWEKRRGPGQPLAYKLHSGGRL